MLEVGPEVTGLHLYQENNEKEEEVMYISEGKNIYRAPLKKEEESKMSESIVLSKN